MLGPDANRPGVRATLRLSDLTAVVLEFSVLERRTVEMGY